MQTLCIVNNLVDQTSGSKGTCLVFEFIGMCLELLSTGIGLEPKSMESCLSPGVLGVDLVAMSIVSGLEPVSLGYSLRYGCIEDKMALGTS